MSDTVQTLTLPDRRLAYQQACAPSGSLYPGMFFLGGYGADMGGTKACYLDKRAREDGRALTRFDYRGHGQSEGRFVDGTLGAWYDDALAVFDQVTTGPQIVIGSSMGGWMALKLAKDRPDRVVRVIGVAAAPDFTEDLVLAALTPRQKEKLDRTGIVFDDDDKADPEQLPFTRAFLDEGRNHLLLRNGQLRLAMPVILLQGLQDVDVPWQHAMKTIEALDAPSARLILVKGADHRMNRPEDLDLLWRTAMEGH